MGQCHLGLVLPALERGRRLGFRPLWSSLGRLNSVVQRKLGRRGSFEIALVHCSPGSFGSPAVDGVDGDLVMFSEVFEAFDRLEANASYAPKLYCARPECLWGVIGKPS